MIESVEYKANSELLDEKFNEIAVLLNQFSVPFFSQRYAGHMCFETSMPAILGWILTILFNPNNVSFFCLTSTPYSICVNPVQVAFEASPITTIIENQVGLDLCQMLGYDTKNLPGRVTPLPWGHLACDGTVANMESMW
jgi:hypothetical protein